MKRSGLKPIKDRKTIIERDKHRCRMCGRFVSVGHVHHLYGRVRVPSWLNVPDDAPDHEVNLVLLCEMCHWRVHNTPPDNESQIQLKEWRDRQAIENVRRAGLENSTEETFGG